MGISNLLQFLKPIVKNSHISKYKNEVIGVDVMCWIHRGLISCAYDIATDNFNDSYLNFIDKMLEVINHYNIKILFVFDGEELPEKKNENMVRKNRREKAKKEVQEIIKKVKNPRTNEMVLKKCIQALSVSKEIIDSVIQFCQKRNIDYIISPYEADAQLSYLCRMGFISCVISEDSDLLVYGCPRVLYKFKNNGECNEISLLPINDLIDINIISEIKNPLSDSFNEFYITPMKELKNDEFDNLGLKESNDAIPDQQNDPRAAIYRQKKNKVNKKKYEQIMKNYIDNFYWPEELQNLKYFTIDMFLAMCILSGCDYTNDFHITGMGIKTAFNLIYQYKSIENIFTFLISHEKWKHKIPSNLNTMQKLMNKYKEIKNAFLQHQVYDFVLCKNIPINQSFNSAFKNNKDSKLIINKIREYSLRYNHSGKKNNCLNSYLEDTLNRGIINNDNFVSQKSISQNFKKDTLLIVSKEESSQNEQGRENGKEQSGQGEILSSNNFKNIFKNFTSECFEYLEISPNILRDCEQSKAAEVADEVAAGVSMDENRKEKGKSNHHQDGCSKQQQAKETIPYKPFDKINNIDVPNLHSFFENTHIHFLQNNTHLNSTYMHYHNSHNNDDERSIQTFGGNGYGQNTIPNDSKRRMKNVNSDNLKNSKRAKIVTSCPQYANSEAYSGVTKEGKTNHQEKFIIDNHMNTNEKEKINCCLKNYNCEGASNFYIGGTCTNDMISNEDNAVHTNDTNNNNNNTTNTTNNNTTTNNNNTNNNNTNNNNSDRMKSAKDMYENMRKNFFLYKTLKEQTSIPLKFSHQRDYSTYDWNAKEEGYTHKNVTNENSTIIRTNEQTRVQFQSEFHRTNSENKHQIKEEKYMKTEQETNSTNGMEVTNDISSVDNNVIKKKNEKNEISSIARSNNFSSFSTPHKSSKSIAKIETTKNQLRITSFFKKASKITNTNILAKKMTNENSNCILKYSPSSNKSRASSEEKYNTINSLINFFPEKEINTVQEGKNIKIEQRTNTFKLSNLKEHHTNPVQNQHNHDDLTFLQNCNLQNCNLQNSSSTNEKIKDFKSISFEKGDSHEVSLFDSLQNAYSSKADQKDANAFTVKKYIMNKKNENKEDKENKENKENIKEINIDYILQNLNNDYQHKSHKINTFDYFKEKENVPQPNPYIDNSL
ncbi:exonuclease I, putative [Plasmodium malariae]|uniref:Exonuclease 1 n=1 Tax=Plasmodium malariae TaxID=5858 RepID=A0A1C3KAD4_PLAMA|nr:exonuclease I, putative [Plasmodium malariae]